MDADLRRALRFVVPYWRRLALVLALSVLSTALSLYLPLLSRDFVDRALIGRDPATLVRIVVLFGAVTLASFAVNIASGLRYTRVSADILFDMRLELYRQGSLDASQVPPCHCRLEVFIPFVEELSGHAAAGMKGTLRVK